MQVTSKDERKEREKERNSPTAVIKISAHNTQRKSVMRGRLKGKYEHAPGIDPVVPKGMNDCVEVCPQLDIHVAHLALRPLSNAPPFQHVLQLFRTKQECLHRR
jgi:hypothetical protein